MPGRMRDVPLDLDEPDQLWCAECLAVVRGPPLEWAVKYLVRRRSQVTVRCLAGVSARCSSGR
jgi:hypothetical protein